MLRCYKVRLADGSSIQSCLRRYARNRRREHEAGSVKGNQQVNASVQCSCGDGGDVSSRVTMQWRRRDYLTMQVGPMSWRRAMR